MDILLLSVMRVLIMMCRIGNYGKESDITRNRCGGCVATGILSALKVKG